MCNNTLRRRGLRGGYGCVLCSLDAFTLEVADLFISAYPCRWLEISLALACMYARSHVTYLGIRALEIKDIFRA